MNTFLSYEEVYDRIQLYTDTAKALALVTEKTQRIAHPVIGITFQEKRTGYTATVTIEGDALKIQECYGARFQNGETDCVQYQNGNVTDVDADYYMTQVDNLLRHASICDAEH